MKLALKEIIDALHNEDIHVDDAWLSKLLRRHNRAREAHVPQLAKRQLRPFYLKLKAEEPELLAAWGVDELCERELLRVLQIKPRRTASGLATITLVTKPHPCSSDCLYCPSDLRMPKSYLPNEPACRRAEQNYFDPYLQTRSRLKALKAMGHIVDKVELIILGGSWSDYPESYQFWFIAETFRALNEFGHTEDAGEQERREFYRQRGFSCDADELAKRSHTLQEAVNSAQISYNSAIGQLNAELGWTALAPYQRASMDDVREQHRKNEQAACRAVGLCIETRPDLISPESAHLMRELGCTKIQMGIQSLDEQILSLNQRFVSLQQIVRSFEILRTFGFKIMVHIMLNLLGSNPELDYENYRLLVSDERFCPDEVKLYPCVLTESSQLMGAFEAGAWQPYSEDELVDVLSNCLSITPAYTRISRMIRDIASTDIVAGNKKPNLRQIVETQALQDGNPSNEIRQREIAIDDTATNELELEIVEYETTVSSEKFCQWVRSDGRIAGFLRLSLPHEGSSLLHAGGDNSVLPADNSAMIRELHIYGRVIGFSGADLGGNQHLGLGRSLIEQACTLAGNAGYSSIRVISAVGTRPYYRTLGFVDDGLYQRRVLGVSSAASTHDAS